MTQQNPGAGQPWPPGANGPQQPSGPPQPPAGQLPPGQQPYGSYSAPYQPRSTSPGGQPGTGYQQGQVPSGQPGQTPIGQPGQTPWMQPGQAQSSADPSTPIGRVQPPRVSIQDFQQPRSRKPLWISLALLALVGAVLWAVIRFAGPSPSLPVQPTPTPLPTPTRTTPTAPPSVVNDRSVPFTNATDDTSGTFEILSYRWSGMTLSLTVRITLDEGEQQVGFFALDNKSARDYEPDEVPGGLAGQVVRTGAPVTGMVQFTKTAGPTTVFLSDSTGRQVAALKVDG